MTLNEYKAGELVNTPADLVGRSVQAYGPTLKIHAGIVTAARYSDDMNDVYADVALVSYAEPSEGRLVSEARLIVQAGLLLGSSSDPKPHTFSINR